MISAAGTAPSTLPPGVTVVQIRTNQAIMNPANPNGPAISQLRPDVQILGSNNLLYFTEINMSGGPGYHAYRQAQLQAALPPGLWGYYTPVNIPPPP